MIVSLGALSGHMLFTPADMNMDLTLILRRDVQKCNMKSKVVAPRWKAVLFGQGNSMYSFNITYQFSGNAFKISPASMGP